MTEQICYKCKRPIKGAEICAECRERCSVCGASGETCKNPPDWMLVLQAKHYNNCMARHRAAGQELPWFKLMDRMNEEASQPD